MFVRNVEVLVDSERLFATLNHVDDASVAESPRPRLVRAVDVLFKSERLFETLSHVEDARSEITPPAEIVIPFAAVYPMFVRADEVL